ncbi:hypothetical protein D9Q98_009167 [Chlorella vulgaris]|uniref:SGNH hydrolase-type esterase domain-containing protein n=1 Tax=Chlorella vulgaris TaxID=3077 RepID=A0A9D4TNX6_CHLVU|nr:hypothetical protein D9Q98_009167 [Chlorella vulgaris]
MLPGELCDPAAGCTWGVMVGRLQTPAVFHTSHPAQADDAMPVPWPPVLQEAQLRRGLGYYGSGARLERVVAKLMVGEPIVAATVGGSVTVGSGSSNLTENGYAPRFFHFLNATFPHRDHVLVNKAIGGTNAGTFGTCLERLVPQDADLITVELTYNEHPNLPFTSSDRKGFEQLLRKLLRMPKAPAIVLLHHFSWHQNIGDGVAEGLYYRGAEPHLATLAQYYDIPSPSLRDAVYAEMRADLAPFKVSKVQTCCWERPSSGKRIEQAEEADRGDYFFADVVHPGDKGHQALAELLAQTLRAAARNVAAAAPRSSLLATLATVSVDTDGGGGSSSTRRVGQQFAAVSVLPPPMIPGNADAETTLCAMQEDFQGVVADAHGFEWAAERPTKETFVQQKWGYRSRTAGAWIELEVSTKTSSEGKVLVLLGYLRSSAHMGLAQVECVSGCTCATTLFDGFWTYRASLRAMHKFPASQHRRCRVRVTVVPRGADDEGAAAAKKKGRPWGVGFKVQLSGIMVASSQPALWAYPAQAGDMMDLGG